MSDPTFVERLANVMQQYANARQVYGEPVEREGTTIIPVARVQWGVGGGGLGAVSVEHGGGGGGVRAVPVGYIEIRDDHSIFRPIVTAADGAILGAATIAGLVAGLLVARLTRR